MEQNQLDKLREWFDGFVDGFYGDDEYINANLKMKHQHSLRTCEEMLGQSRFYSKLIRDADKLEALYVVTNNLIEYNENPDNFALEVEYPDVPR